MPNRRKPKNKSKKKYRKGKRANDSESSTPHSSTPSVEDERQQLIQGGACGSGDSSELRATEKTKDAERDSSGESPCRNTGESSKNASKSDNSSKMDLLAVPDQESGACGPRSPSRSPLNLLKNVLTPKKKSPNRSSDFECICTDKKKHQPECPKLKNLMACAKVEGLESESTEASANESKPSSSDASPIVSKKNKDCTQSSSSSDPSGTEYFKNSTEPGQALEGSLPTALDQGSGACGQSSPSKKSPLTLLKNVFKHKRSSPNRSPDTKRSFEDKTKRETGAKSKRLGRTKSEASSSGSSSISRKNNDGNSSNVSSENSRHSSSKSFSNSDPNNVELSSDKGIHSSECQRNPRDYDPQEGTSMGPARYETKREHGGSVSEIEDISQDLIPIIEPMDKEHDANCPIPRRRSKSFSFFRLLRTVNSRHPSPRRYNLRSLGIQLSQIEWSWLEQMRRPVHPNVGRTDRANDPDENERGLLRRVESVMPDPSTRRHASLSPIRVRDCNCGAGNDGIDHNISCSRHIDLRRRRNLRRCRQSPRRF